MNAEPLVIREDLSKRTVLSKSALVTFDLCQEQARGLERDRSFRPFLDRKGVLRYDGPFA